MILIDKKVAKAALKLTDNYNDEIVYLEDTSELAIVVDFRKYVKRTPLNVPAKDVPFAINRLVDKGYFQISSSFMGGCFFSITPYLTHRFAFWLDSFTKRFWNGFIVGVLSSLFATQLYHWFTTLLTSTG